MKKIIAIILACVTLLSLAACNSAATPTAPDDWNLKYVKKPNWTIETQEVTFTQNDKEVKDKLAVSPFTFSEFNPTEDVKALQNLEVLKGWSITTEKSEAGMSYETATAYMNCDTITIAELKDGKETGKRIQFSYASEPSTCIGYQTIQCDVSLGDANKLTQKEVHDVMQVVYGEQYAKLLCYGKMKQEDKADNYAKYETVKGDVVIECSRSYSENTLSFALVCTNTNTSLHGYTGEYKPSVTQLPMMQDVLNWSGKDCEITNWGAIGSDWVSKYYGDGYTFNQEAFGLYVYTETTFNNETTKTFSCDGTFKHDDKLKYTPGLLVSWKETSDSTDGAVILSIGALTKDEVTDEAKNTLKQKALLMVQDILKTEVSDSVFEDNVVYETTLDGKSAYMNLRLDFSPDEEGNVKAFLTVGVATDKKFLETIE
jgi:hypothetical protein